jgi:hypothetical protein
MDDGSANLESNTIPEYLLVIAENHHFSTPRVSAIQCQQTDCPESFTQWGEWSRHARKMKHDIEKDRGFDAPMQFGLPDPLLKEYMDLHSALLEATRKHLRQWSNYLETLGNKNSELWCHSKDALLKQLETDPLVKQDVLPLIEDPVFRDFSQYASADSH